MKLRLLAFAIIGLFAVIPLHQARTTDVTQYWMKIKATDKFERSVIADTGVSIEHTDEDYVIAIGNLQEKERIEKLGWMDVSFALTEAMDFPSKDAEYHNYAEMTEVINKLAAAYPNIAKKIVIGKSVQGREIIGLRVSGDLAHAETKPAVFFMGGHHAREHLSVETPLRITQWLLEEYTKGNPRVVGLVNSRDIHVVPAINPDGLEWDVEGGRYKTWRKNRAQNGDGTYGVDLNRNYGHGWGTGGSSKDTSSDVYMGPKPFSEPETQAVKKWVEDHENITVLLSFHTFSKLILYPWGATYDPISDSRARNVHETMAKKMAEWNGYTPQQSSDLYIASGDTTDWSYGEHKIISFTFELDPANNGWGAGGFYPGAKIIDEVVKKNTEPYLYLLEYADNPYRVIDEIPIKLPF